MLMTMKPDLQQNLENLGAYDMLQELKTMFSQQAKQELLQTMGNNQGKGMSKLAYASKPKIPPPPKKENLAKDSGFRRNRKLKPGALSLYMGNGQHASVEAFESYDLCFPSGLVAVLHNCHYAPSITRGVILVSRLYDNGFINRFDGNVISFSRNNVVYFSVVPRDGIYEIDLSNSNTNNSSMYDVSNKRAKLNLDSTHLWHCRLGHISKKCIEKLQHDGLLNSTDNQYFDKCVSCMSGKMARKPYSHQVERSKDLLGLITKDVCGPFKIVSRQGASYFVTFTDDFSRYGYVYLFKHKHEVFETFKVFQKEVENQVGYPKETMGYSFYYPPENKVFVARNIEFLENSLITQEASGSLDDLEVIQEADTHPFKNTSIHQDEVLMNVEMQFMKDNDVWDLVDLPPNSKTVGNKWLFKKKTDMDGATLECFAMKDLREDAYILGIKIYRDRSKRLIGAASLLGEAHWTAGKNILKYLCITKDMFLVYRGDIKRELRVSCYTDVGYLTDADDLKSQTGYVFILNGGAVDWKSTKQSIFITSSAEAEYIASLDAFKEAVWVKKFISGLRVVPTIEDPISMYCDNIRAITIANESGFT
ncbi:ribonuclease H-like domain-containing protein [Tanacetum coccineum]